MTIISAPKSFLRGSEGLFQPSGLQPSGYEGQALYKKINDVGKIIREPESVKRFIKIDENKTRQGDLKDYINSLCSGVDEIVDEATDVVDYALQVWQELSKYFFGQGLHLEVPDACLGRENDFMYTWSSNEHYLECEIFGSSEVEFFYRNRKSGEVWGEDTTLANGFSTSVLEKVSIFAW